MLRIEGLSVKYLSTGRGVIDRLDLSVQKGETIAVIGPSGIGKTTFLNIIAGLFDPKEVQVSGKIKLSAKRVSTVFQEPRLLPWRTVLDNVAFGLEAAGNDRDNARKKALSSLKKVGLADYQKYYPAQLSLGMKQRVNFARAIAVKPDLLLMDEPFSALDDATKNEVIGQFRGVIKDLGVTTLFVTHNQEEAKFLSDRIITLKKSFVGVSRNFGKTNTKDLYGGFWEIG